MTTGDRDKRCKGCCLFRMEITWCIFHDESKEDECPCTICLVKAMCTETCEDRYNIIQRIQK